MKETWEKCVTVWQAQVEFCSCKSVSCVIPEILLSIKDTFHFSLDTFHFGLDSLVNQTPPVRRPFYAITQRADGKGSGTLPMREFVNVLEYWDTVRNVN